LFVAAFAHNKNVILDFSTLGSTELQLQLAHKICRLCHFLEVGHSLRINNVFDVTPYKSFDNYTEKMLSIPEKDVKVKIIQNIDFANNSVVFDAMPIATQ
jgi:hypothetical protein